MQPVFYRYIYDITENPMVLLYKNNGCFKLKALLLLLLVGCYAVKTSAQDFKWLYSPVGISGDTYGLIRCHITTIATNSNNEIYATGDHMGEHNFGDEQHQINIKGSSGTAYFITKLDENKNVLWAKQFDFGNRIMYFGDIVFDDNGNVFISGMVELSLTSAYLNPNPANPSFPNVYAPTQENLQHGHFYGFVIKLNAQGNYINSIILPDIYLSGMVKDHDNNFVATGESLFDVLFPFRKWAILLNSITTSIYFGKSILTTRTAIPKMVFSVLHATARIIFIAQVLTAKASHSAMLRCNRIWTHRTCPISFANFPRRY
ncbi:hypothetical protein [Flavobacterium sp. 3HN19-14]|uniref:hypothetical protein n=1 Tax=Flavobacterium sp. 3HN19-14 TaxID=3448133 RepID=UPI003EE2E813